jgi:hypothetical protein
MRRPTVRDAVLEALRDHEGGSTSLQRVLNLTRAAGPGEPNPPAVDFSGTLGDEAWALAVAAGNWRAAGLIVQGGYRPSGQDELADDLVEPRFDASDFNARPPVLRLRVACGGHRSHDHNEARLEKFILRMGGPWSQHDLDTCLFLAVLEQRARVLIQTLIAAGANVDARLEDVRARLLDDVALTERDLVGLSWQQRLELLRYSKMDSSVFPLLLEDRPGATPARLQRPR